MLLVAVLACERQVLAPPEQGFLAIIINAEGPAEVSPGHRYAVRVQELSGTLGIDDTLTATPNDTIILEYPLATYDVRIDGVPPACTARFGLAQRARISFDGNTSVARFRIHCASLLAFEVLTDGPLRDSAYVWRAVTPEGRELAGASAASDTIRLDDIGVGEHLIELAHIASNCEVTSPGGRRQRPLVAPPQATLVRFRVRCSDPEKQPRTLHFASSYSEGHSAFHAVIHDPDLDLDNYSWTITDCQGQPVFDDVGFTRRGLRQSRAVAGDTLRVAITVRLPGRSARELTGRCTAVRFTDLQGNTTHLVEERIGNETGRPPHAASFDARHEQGRITIALDAGDADGDLAGAFVSVGFIDGTMFSPDGEPDIGIYNVQGYPVPIEVPDFVLDGNRFRPANVLWVAVDLIDRMGNVTRVTDDDLS